MNSLVKAVLDRLLEDIDAGKNPWKKSWKGGGGLPSNATTSRNYRGINTLILWLAEQDGSYAASRWATFKQWAGAGRHVRKGEKGTSILFYKILEKGEGADATRFPMLRVSWVFNEQQLVEAEAQPEVAQPTPDERHAAAQLWFDGAGIKLCAGTPSYSQVPDMVSMPSPADFTSLDEYWATLFHEGVHWTGHKTRLDRSLVGHGVDRFAYAREELTAEIGAAFMNAEFGIDTVKNNAAYLRGWLKDFDDKREAIFTAAKQAGAAFELLTAKRQAMEVAA